MNEMQFYVSVAVVPAITVVIVLIGVLLNTQNFDRRLTDAILFLISQ